MEQLRLQAYQTARLQGLDEASAAAVASAAASAARDKGSKGDVPKLRTTVDLSQRRGNNKTFAYPNNANATALQAALVLKGDLLSDSLASMVEAWKRWRSLARGRRAWLFVMAEYRNTYSRHLLQVCFQSLKDARK